MCVCVLLFNVIVSVPLIQNSAAPPLLKQALHCEHVYPGDLKLNNARFNPDRKAIYLDESWHTDTF